MNQQYYQQPMQAIPQQPMQVNPQQALQLQQQMNANVGRESLLRSRRPPSNRAKIEDGDHVVELTSVPDVRHSQQGNFQYLLIEYKVVDSTVQRCIGQAYAHVIKWIQPWQIEECSDIYKAIWGVEAAEQFALTNPNPDQIVQQICAGFSWLAQNGPVYAHLNARRSQKKLREGYAYADVYPNHWFGFFTNQQFSLEQIGKTSALSGSAVQQPQMAPQQPQMAPQQPQMAPQAPQQPQMAPQAPQQPQMGSQAPQMGSQAPQQPQMAPQAPQAPQQPQTGSQAPQQPQMAPQAPQGSQPSYVPDPSQSQSGGLPPPPSPQIVR